MVTINCYFVKVNKVPEGIFYRPMRYDEPHQINGQTVGGLSSMLNPEDEPFHWGFDNLNDAQAVVDDAIARLQTESLPDGW